jgi:pSer/pThr/pTyr-binding forkhead associated (FHA) protein
MDVKLTVAEGATKNQTIRLRSEETLVGRRQGCHVRIPSSSVSRRHCRLIFRNDYLAVEDLASINGTFVNGQRVRKTKVLRPGDKLQIGCVLFVVKYLLSPEALDRLLAQEQQEEAIDVEPVDVEDVVEAAAASEVVEAEAASDEDLDEAIPVDMAEPTIEVDVVEVKDEDTPDASAMLAKPWDAPSGDHLRDILTKLEKEE